LKLTLKKNTFEHEHVLDGLLGMCSQAQESPSNDEVGRHACLTLPAQAVDATPSSQLIRQYFPLGNRSVWLYSVKT
jgi:hypothetical protein